LEASGICWCLGSTMSSIRGVSGIRWTCWPKGSCRA
jgi:hypothetical protein